MKRYICLLLAFSFVSMGFSQEKSSKSVREEKRIHINGKIEQLINSENFEFVGITAFPLGSTPVDLSSNSNSVIFTRDLISADMPFYGTGYSGMALSRDTGMRFHGKPGEFTVERKENGFEIKTDVTGKSDTYILSLSVRESGSALLTISSTDRSTISYQGEIRAVKR